MFLLPAPSCIEILEGSFYINPSDFIIAPNSGFGFKIAKELIGFIEDITGITLELGIDKSCRCVEFVFCGGMKEQEYKINVEHNGIEVIASTEKGLFYGLQTLKQIIKQQKRCIQLMHISDEPIFESRGFYHDVTRGKVPTLKSLKDLVDMAAQYKINQLQLYVEHTYLFKGHSEISVNTDPLTAQEIIELDEYCSERFVELVPSIATFGHLYEALSSSTFCELCELDDSDEKVFSWVDRMDHHTLDVSNDKSIKFVQDMIDQFAPLFKSDKFNICADETFDLGKGKNEKLAKKVGTSKLYVDFLNKIVKYLKEKYHKKVMFWGDIIIKHPEYIDELPKDLICLNWWYWMNYSEDKVKVIDEHGFKQYVCPGVHGWNRLMNDFKLSYDNIKMMTSYGRKYNAIGVLNTDWGDYGHWNLFANSIAGLIYGAQFSWSRHEISFDDLNREIDILQFSLTNEHSVMRLLNEVSNMHYMTLLPLVEFVQKGKVDYLKKINIDTENIMNSDLRLLEIENELLDIMVIVDKNQRDFINSYYLSVKGIRLLNRIIPHIKKVALDEEISVNYIYESNQCAIDLEKWVMNYKKMWLKRNKYSELYRIVDFVKVVTRMLRKIKN